MTPPPTMNGVMRNGVMRNGPTTNGVTTNGPTTNVTRNVLTKNGPTKNVMMNDPTTTGQILMHGGLTSGRDHSGGRDQHRVQTILLGHPQATTLSLHHIELVSRNSLHRLGPATGRRRWSHD